MYGFFPQVATPASPPGTVMGSGGPSNSLASSSASADSVEVYFECITSCSLDDGECVTRCVEQLRLDH